MVSIVQPQGQLHTFSHDADISHGRKCWCLPRCVSCSWLKRALATQDLLSACSSPARPHLLAVCCSYWSALAPQLLTCYWV